MTKSICIENVSKQYRLGQVGTGTISHDLNRWWARMRGKEDPFARVGEINDRSKISTSDYVWALKDIDLEVDEGDIVGIIGRNGAGKSTLLKLLSRVTGPTTGRIKTRGRIASLLEVGTGFHPEMTGRENIYMNGSILGMKRHEISRELDAIVEFSGCAKYLDTPVKRYSSGMMVRLGFAVAAHLQCEILIVDEVLAVGDAEFQKRCIGKMQDISTNSGRTILFVSHVLSSIEQLCKRLVVIVNGTLDVSTQDIPSGIGRYLLANKAEDTTAWNDQLELVHPEYFRPLRVQLTNSNHELISGVVQGSDDLFLNVDFDINKPTSALVVGYAIYNSRGDNLYWSFHTDQSENQWINLKPGLNSIQTQIPTHLLNEGEYRIELLAALHHREWLLKPRNYQVCVNFSIMGGLSDSPNWTNARSGLIAPTLAWTTSPHDNLQVTSHTSRENVMK